MLNHELITNLGELHTLNLAVATNPYIIENPDLFALDKLVRLDKFSTVINAETANLMRVI